MGVCRLAVIEVSEAVASVHKKEVDVCAGG